MIVIVKLESEWAIPEKKPNGGGGGGGVGRFQELIKNEVEFPRVSKKK